MAMQNDIVPLLTSLFNEVLRTETVPTQWTTSTIILIHKKGDKGDVGNYRPISLMSNIYKIFAKIILSRLTRVLDENQPREQAGFRSKYSVVDHVQVVRQIFEKYKEYGLPLYCCFVDYCKAFDSLEHNSIWNALKKQGVDDKYIRIIKNIYTGSTAKVKLEREGEIINIEKGVRQGDPLSPKLFTAVLEDVFRQFDWSDHGLRINGEYLSNLRFADDIILFAKSSQELQRMLTDLDTCSKQVGLNMNTSKTKAMTNRAKEKIIVNNIEIEYVDEYTYLGQIIATNNTSSKEIETRIGHAWNRYWSYKEIMKDRKINISAKGKLFNTSILPILTYGCQTWALTKSQQTKLQTCQRAMERSMIGKRKVDKIRHTNIRKATKVEDVVVKLRTLKWKWAGHTMRGDDRWSKVVTNWYPREGKRRKGKPLKRWEDDLVKMAGKNWMRTARERKEWKSLEEAFAGGHTGEQQNI